MSMDELKNFDANRMDLEALVELSAFARTIEGEYVALKVAAPEWVTVQAKSLRREITSRLADAKEKSLREKKARLATLKTTEEKRKELADEIAALESEGVGA